MHSHQPDVPMQWTCILQHKVCRTHMNNMTINAYTNKFDRIKFIYIYVSTLSRQSHNNYDRNECSLHKIYIIYHRRSCSGRSAASLPEVAGPFAEVRTARSRWLSGVIGTRPAPCVGMIRDQNAHTSYIDYDDYKGGIQ